MNNRGVSKFVWLFLVLVVLVVAIYFTFFFAYKCDDLTCFKSHQKECAKTKFIYETDEIDWRYFIRGKKDNKCEIEVEAMKINQGSIENQKLEGKTMICLLELGSTASPEADIAICHGLLKEELQNIIIKKLHSYVVENIGEIGSISALEEIA